MAEDLAKVAGLLVSPGELYGGAGHVRIAVVQPMERLVLVANRLAAAGWHSAAR
jgi:aspartate/methionine/tyrosine aminotransferase